MASRDSGRGRSRDFEPATLKLITPPLRLSYAKLFDPIQNDQGKDVWETDALVPPNCYFPKNHPDFPDMHLSDALFETMGKVMSESWGHEDEWPRGRNDYHPKDKIKKLDPDNLPGKGVDEKWEKFTARSYQPVGIVDADKNDVLNKREVYGGRWARLSLTVATYDSKGSKGVTLYLNNVQLLDHDDSFGGRPSADADFDRYDGPEQAPSGRRGRDRDDDDRRGGRDDEDDRGRGRGRGSRDDDRAGSGRGSREDRGGGRDRDRSGDRGDSRGRDDGPSRGRGRDDDRGRDRDDRDRGRERDGGGSRRGRDDQEDRDDSRGRSSSRDRDDRDRSSSREAEEGEGRGRGRGRDDRGYRGNDRHEGDDALEREERRNRDDRGGRDAGRGRGRDRDEDQDEERPSSRGGRGSRDDDRDWN